MMSIDNILIPFIPVFVISLIAEVLWDRRRHHEIYEKKDTLACLAMGVGNIVVAAPLKLFWLWLYGLVYTHRVFEIPMTAAWGWVLLLVADDFCYYWFHRLHHTVRLLWCTHSIHHSSQRFNLAVALRQPWTESLTAYWFWLPLPLLGFHPIAIIGMQSISLIYQFFVHTETVRSLGWLEWIINTPAHHRVHHGRNAQYLDKNYGGIFIVWDRLFGSFEPEGERVRYGLVKNLDTYNPFRIAFGEWAAMIGEVTHARSWRAAWTAIAAPPGTSLR
jgi:sterol desaturase/sphingolipid hydroxylase (fatty acid hydroxylase superfamily)